MFRDMYAKADSQRQANVLRIHIIQPSKLVRFRMLMAESWKKDGKSAFEKITKFKK
jgi:hypothetical protein